METSRRSGDLEATTYVELLRTTNVLSQIFVEIFAAHGLTPKQFNVLRILFVRDQGVGVTCQEIGNRLIHRVPDVTRLLDRLESAGWVARNRSKEDRRVVLTCLTSEGIKFVQQLEEPLFKVHKQQLSHMSRKDIRELHRLLVLMRKSKT